MLNVCKGNPGTIPNRWIGILLKKSGMKSKDAWGVLCSKSHFGKMHEPKTTMRQSGDDSWVHHQPLRPQTFTATATTIWGHGSFADVFCKSPSSRTRTWQINLTMGKLETTKTRRYQKTYRIITPTMLHYQNAQFLMFLNFDSFFPCWTQDSRNSFFGMVGMHDHYYTLIERNFARGHCVEQIVF